MDEGRFYIPKRYILTAFSFLGMFNVYALRVNLSVAMVAMVNSTKEVVDNLSLIVVECPNIMRQEKAPEEFHGDHYNWDAQTQGLILGSFFYGYILTQVPGGYISQRFGAKWLFGGGVLITSVLSLLTPFAASQGTIPFIIVRVLEGLAQGVTFPSMNAIVSRWAPKLERSRLSTVIFTGAEIGNVISMPVSGWLSSTELLGGWPSAFYVFGTVGCIWFLFWAYLIHETPAAHPTISARELSFFDSSDDEIAKKKAKTPWKSIITSMPMWAVLIAHFGDDFGHLVFLTELPSYLSTALHFGIKDNGLLSALPYIFKATFGWIASVIADKLRKSNTLSITNIRKLCNTIGFFGPAICLLAITVSGCRRQLIVTLLSIGMALNGFVFSGFNVTHVDMSPSFAGLLYSITNTVASLCGIIAPATVGAFTEGGATMANWSNVFYITAAIYILPAIFFLLFASAELQPWADGKEDSSDDIPIKGISDPN